MPEAASAEPPISLSERLESAARWIGGANLQTGGDLLLRVQLVPDELADLSAASWNRLMPLAKFLGCWSQIAVQVQRRELVDRIPAPVRRHLQSAVVAAGGHEARICWELNRLQAALTDVTCPLILLKGTAFLVSGFPFALGRRFQDLDILVPKDHLAAVELAVRRHGWVYNEESPLHAQYYRTWLHELAPLWHPDRRVALDVHYTIIPPKDRIPFDPSSLFERATPVGGGRLHVLAPADMFLHATSNLFRTGEFTYLLRDLHDMHSMLGQFSRTPGFWNDLIERASQLHLQQTCFLALRYVQKVFATPIPEDVSAAIDRWRPKSVFLGIIDACVRRSLFPRSLGRLDSGRNLVLKLREYWPPPRLRTVFSYVFWRKRLPDSRRAGGRNDIPDNIPPAGNPNGVG